MEMFLPQTVRQAKWLLVGGVLVFAMGVLRGVAFFGGGGIMFIVMGTLFATLGVLSVVAAIMRMRRGDEPAKRARPGGSA
jgi:hypothetical protein